MFAGFTSAEKTIIQNWFAPHMCAKTYWISSLLIIVTCEYTTAQMNKSKPGIIACRYFSSNILSHIEEWLYNVTLFFFLSELQQTICLLFLLARLFVLMILVCLYLKDNKNIKLFSPQKMERVKRWATWSKISSNVGLLSGCSFQHCFISWMHSRGAWSGDTVGLHSGGGFLTFWTISVVIKTHLNTKDCTAKGEAIKATSELIKYYKLF